MSKSLVKNSIFNVLYQLLNVIFPLISATYVARILMPVGMGIVASAQNWVQYFVIFAALGVPNYAVREVAKVRLDQTSLNKVFTELFIINAISTSISLAFYVVMITSIPMFRENLLLYAVVGISILFNYLNVDWLYQGVESYGFIAVRSFIVKVTSLAALLLFVHHQNDYVIYALISACAIGLNNILNCIHIRTLDIHFVIRNLVFRKHIKPIFLVFSTIVSIKVYTLFDVTMLSLMSDDQAVAYYTNTDKIVRLIITIIAGIGGVLLPRISLYHSQGKLKECADIISKVFEILFFFFLPVGVGLILTSSQLVYILFGSAYVASIPTMQIMALLIFALGFSNLFGTQVLLSFNEEKKLMVATVIGGLINIVLNLILIPSMAQNGTAVASVVSEALVTLITYIYATRVLHFSIRRHVIGQTVIATIIMAAVVVAANTWISNVYLSFITSVVLGGASFFLLSWFMKNPIMSFMMKYVKR